jgi:hypothetical protein
MLFFLNIIGDQIVHQFFRHFLDILPQVFSPEHLFPLLIDNLPLPVHDVIIFEEVFTNIEVLSFHSFLSVFDGF